MSAPVGRFLRDARIGRGILLFDLARRVGITSAELSAIEHGRSVPDEAQLRRLLAALSLDLPVSGAADVPR